MKWLSRALDGLERRDETTTFENPADWLTAAFGAGRTISGVKVTGQKAYGLPPFWRGVNLLAGSVGMLPCKVYRPIAGEQASMGQRDFRRWLGEEARANRVGVVLESDLRQGRVEVGRLSRPWQLLHDMPNAVLGLAADEFWAIIESHIDTWGRAYAFKDRGEDGRVANLWPLAPHRVRTERDKQGRRHFIIDGNVGEPLSDFEVMHFRGLSLDGLDGYSPIQIHRESLGAAISRDEFEQVFWANDATPGVVIRHPATGRDALNPEGVDRVKALWEKHHKGTRNRNKVAVIAEGATIERTTMPLKDAQFIEQKRLSATDTAHILNLPPEMVGGETGGSLTYNTLEGQGLAFLKWSLSPRLVRIQNVVTHDADVMPVSWFAEFEPGAILRASTKERYEAWATAPHLMIDEMRALDNLPPLPNGEGQKLSKSAPVAPGAPEITPGDAPTTEDEENE